jgi:Peptidase family S41
MIIRAIASLLVIWVSVSYAGAADFLPIAKRNADFASFCRFVKEEYAYFDIKKTDWKRVCMFYAARLPEANDRDAYIEILELAISELYDHHAHLGTNTSSSYRLVPTQTDLFATWVGGRATIAEVRKGSSAEGAGLLAGMEIVAVNGEPVETLVKSVEPKFLSSEDPTARQWALQVALAGRRDRSATLLLISAGGKPREFKFILSYPEPSSPLSYRSVGGVGYVRINNSLGEQALVPAFDKAVSEMSSERALVIDLRDTPSGGNSAVARGIMGRFVNRLLPYQRHELVSEFRSNGIRRVWEEYVAPRESLVRKPIVVLVGRWTASMGEGLAIGLNAARGAPVLGQPMAHLLGANGEMVLPHSNIVVRVPTEKLFHIGGTPREAFVPCAVARLGRDSPPQDYELKSAIDLAHKLSLLKHNPSVIPMRSSLPVSCATLDNR